MSSQPIDKVWPGGVGVKWKPARACCYSDQGEGGGDGGGGGGGSGTVRFSSAGIMKAAKIFNTSKQTSQLATLPCGADAPPDMMIVAA